ncbi:MAG: hypothetical protein GQ540_07400 [Lutibacter sp.]|uniref:hypothetical protein n=1 Tax=Lutibacter sp. TaxID=1925666 RepID=UPI0019DD8220|nr:hypothetical protein [Lutibacter sp.]NOR28337.1 hypothetical protein [Lutibacter sp.]
MKLKPFILTILLLIITSLSQAQSVPSNNKSVVYFTRPPFVGGAVGFRFYDSDKYIGKTTFGQFIKYECNSGEHVFGLLVKDITGTTTCFTTLNLQPGGTYYLKAEIASAKEIKASKKEKKAAKKAGNKAKKVTLFKLTNLVNDSKSLAKVKAKVNKKSPESFSKEELMKGELKFAEVMASSINDYKNSNPSIANNSSNSNVTSNIGVGSSSYSSLSNLASNTTNVSANGINNEPDYNKMTVSELEIEKKKAISEENYILASKLKQQILLKSESIAALEIEKEKAISEENYILANQIKQKILLKEEELRVKNSDNTTLSKVVATNSESNKDLNVLTNKREEAFAEIKKGAKVSSLKSIVSNSSVIAETEKGGGKNKISKSEINKSEGKINYRRSSLYTLMINDNSREHANVIKDAFGNFPLAEKFNDHNIGPYLITTELGIKDQTNNINNFLNTNNIAKQMVAKWFNRSESGSFNVDLIADRGSYNASDVDVKIAKNSERGLAMLSDAGEELIGNSFVIINDYKFTNKEEVAKKAGGLLRGISKIASLAGYSDVANVANYASVGVAVVGKGYVIKTTAYLYRLVWNEEIAATFYNDYWIDDTSLDLAKKEAFEKSDIFRLELVGTESAWADVQSTVFTKKSDQDIIRVSTVKATDKAIAKLQRKFEAFRTKSPLLSGDPISAKIGLKEDIEKGDKYEVLEQVINKKGKTEYKRVGVIKVEKKKIWDNRYMAQEENKSEIEYTTFSGAKNKYFAGMLIRQIN